VRSHSDVRAIPATGDLSDVKVLRRFGDVLTDYSATVFSTAGTAVQIRQAAKLLPGRPAAPGQVSRAMLPNSKQRFALVRGCLFWLPWKRRLWIGYGCWR
jgi:hypothetical protein